MKKQIFTMFLVVLSTGAFAQMKIWSNGTIIFSHYANNVDSISFGGTPMKVQANLQAAGSTSFSGLTFVNYTNDSKYYYGEFSNFLFFTSDSTCILALTGDGKYASVVDVRNFTYTISGSNITLSAKNTTILGSIAGQSGILLKLDGRYYPFLIWK